MSLVNQTLKLEITPGGVPPKLHVTEYDENMQVVAQLFQRGQYYEIPSGTTAKVEGTLAGHPFSADATVDGSNVTFELTKSMTAYAGRAWTKIKLTKDGKPVSTCGFWLDCDRAGVEADTVIGADGFQEQINQAVAEYIEDSGLIIDSTLSRQGAAADAKATGDAISALSGEIAGLSGGGISATARGLLITVLRNGVYSSDQSANITALETALVGSGGGDTPVEPDEPVVATYTITAELVNVTSDNSSASVNEGDSYTATLTAADGYILDSVTITMGGVDVTADVYADGTVTIAAVTGNVVITASAVEVSTGENNGWLNGVPYADMGWIDGYIVKSGNVTEDSGMSASDFLPCRGASGITVENWYSNAGISFYDENKEFVMVTGAFFTEPVPVPLNAYYARFNKRTSTTNTVATPKLFDKLTEHTVYELGKYYSLDWESGKVLDRNTGAEKTSSNPIENVSAYAFCMGATTVTFAEKVRSLVCFYDSNKTFISSDILSATINTVNIPGSAAYFRYDTWDYNDGHNVWVKLA